MKCLGCFRKPKQKGEGHEAVLAKQSHEPMPSSTILQQQASSKKSLGDSPSESGLAKRGSLQSTNSVYYDCQDILDGPGSIRGSSLKGSSSNPSLRAGSAANGASELQGSNSEQSRALRKLLAGSLRLGEHRGSVEGIGQYEQADPTGFMVRGRDYMSDKRKVQAQGEFYRLIGCDVYQFEQKIHHIAQYIQLPEPPRLSPAHSKLPPEKQLPPLLIVNIQLPLYKAAMIPGRGNTDGKAVHIVQYFGLPEDFEPSDVDNDAAVNLLKQLINDEKASNGDKIRDRLKLIARVVNVEEWAQKAPLSGYEHSLLRNYNDKPILTRPQHRFYQEASYLEIDLDVHSYAWAARKALSGFLPRLGSVVFENALIVQGNSKAELPEVVMACARLSHLDFSKAQPFPGELHNKKRSSDHGMTIDHPLHANTFPDDNMSTDARESEDSHSGRSP